MEIVFATQNRHKVKEISELLGEAFILTGMEDLAFQGELPEEHETLEENASQKAWFVYRKFGKSCFADDTGLEVQALNGEPGVYSARYARTGEPSFPEMEPSEGNIRKLLLKMNGLSDRKARFRTVISLILEGKEYRFEGVVNGEIVREPAGMEGFGYDPVFVPEGYDRTFAEMELSLKNRISHRALAVNRLAEFLRARTTKE